jgi:nucleoside-diphosphate-sugar epimerase
VTGATGFIGKNLVCTLTEHGCLIRAMSRKATYSLPDTKRQLQFVIADMSDEGSLRRAVANMDAVVHLAALKSDEPESDDVNIGGAERLVRVCREQNCKRLINISTQSAGIGSKGIYARTKGAAEDVFNSSDLQVTNLRISVVYGEEESGVFGTILKYARRLPCVPILGDGKWLSAPIYIRDVSAAIMGCLTNDRTIGNTYFIGGPDVVSLDELIDRVCKVLGIRRAKIHIPFSVALLAVKILATIWTKCPITVSNVLGSNQNTDVSIKAARDDFAFDPIPLDKGLDLVLRREGNNARTEINDSLGRDFELIVAYLLDTTPSQSSSVRFVAAHQKLLGGQHCAEWKFVRRYPWSLAYLDAAAGLLAPDSMFRKKIVLAAAILETTPEQAAFYLHEVNGRSRLVWLLLSQVITSVSKLTLGVPLWLIASRRCATR